MARGDGTDILYGQLTPAENAHQRNLHQAEIQMMQTALELDRGCSKGQGLARDYYGGEDWLLSGEYLPEQITDKITPSPWLAEWAEQIVAVYAAGSLGIESKPVQFENASAPDYFELPRAGQLMTGVVTRVGMLQNTTEPGGIWRLFDNGVDQVLIYTSWGHKLVAALKLA